MGRHLRKQGLTYLALLPLLWFLGWSVFFPAFNSLRLSLGADQGGLTLQYFREFFQSSKNVLALRNTFVLGIATVLVCGVLGTALAFITTRLRFTGRRVFDVLLMVPMMVPGVLFTIAFMQIYGQTGFIPQLLKQWLHLSSAPDVLTGFWGILFVHATTQYLFFYVMVSSALRRMDASVYEAARILHASKVRTFFTVTLPLLTPALVGASVLTFMSGIGSFAAPNLIGGEFRVMSVQILLTKTNGYYNLVSVQGLLLALMAILFLGVMRFYETRRNYVVDVKGKPLEPIIVRGWGKNLLVALGMTVLLVLILLPVLSIVLLSFVPKGGLSVDVIPKTLNLSNYYEFFHKKRIITPFWNSLRMAGIATLAATVIGTISAYLIVKTKIKIRFLVEFLVFLPWALPPSTTGINMILAFNQPTPFAFGQVLVGTSILLPLAYAVTRITLIVRSTSASLYQLHDSLEEASRSLGATWLKTFFQVLIPIVTPAIISGALMSFVALTGEYTMSVLMFTPSTMPVSVGMINSMTNFNTGIAMVYGVFLVMITVLVVMLSKWLDRADGGFSF